jgi:HSP20 family protein
MIRKKEKENKLAVRPSDPSGDITTLRPADLWSEMDRMFDNFRTNFDDLFWPWGHRVPSLSTMTQKRTPPMDVADLGDHYEMKIEMPGIPKDNVDIQVTANTVEIKAECDDIKEEKGKNWLRRECSGMSFYRALELPEELQTDSVDAELKDGILLLKLPKMEPKPEYKPKKVNIK